MKQENKELSNYLFDIGFQLPIVALGSTEGGKLTSFDISEIPCRISDVVNSVTRDDREPLLVPESILDGDDKIGEDYTILFREKKPQNIPIYNSENVLVSSINLDGYESFYKKIREDKSLIRRFVDKDFLSRSFWEINRQILCGYWQNYGFVLTEFAFAGERVVPTTHGYLFYAQPTYSCPQGYRVRGKGMIQTIGEKSVIDF